MDVRYYENDKIIEIELQNSTDDSPSFDLIANQLTAIFKVHWKEKIVGWDEIYWDFEFKGVMLTLHLHTMVGIMVFVHKTHHDLEKARQILEEIGSHFKDWKPQR